LTDAWWGQLPLLNDPWFYAVAVPAVLLVGLSKSGFASGFGSLATPMMALVIGLTGALTLAFLAQRLLFPPRQDAPPAPAWVGSACATVSGFTSFVAHAGGPPLAAYLLPQKLPPLAYSGTMAVFFGVVNLAKWVPFSALGLIDLRNMATALVLLPLAPAGVWLGVWMTRHVSNTWFYRLAYTGMLLTGLKLLWDGLR